MESKEQVIVSAPNFQTVEVEIKGAAPYVQHRFGHKALLEIREKQESGLTTKGKKRKARNFYVKFPLRLFVPIFFLKLCFLLSYIFILLFLLQATGFLYKKQLIGRKLRRVRRF